MTRMHSKVHVVLSTKCQKKVGCNVVLVLALGATRNIRDHSKNVVLG